MAQRTRTVKLSSGVSATGVVIYIEESTERWCEFHLADGAILAAKIVGIDALRIEDQKDQDGNPIYSLQNQIVTVLRKPPDAPSGSQH